YGEQVTSWKSVFGAEGAKAPETSPVTAPLPPCRNLAERGMQAAVAGSGGAQRPGPSPLRAQVAQPEGSWAADRARCPRCQTMRAPIPQKAALPHRIIYAAMHNYLFSCRTLAEVDNSGRNAHALVRRSQT
ncbi:hypothetical protein, partial [Paracidovorax cattleyae]|uniref:hypothetical protein n=1 Tax=Paracidovorax cattleyae TaxID=80868 RepID=UPI001E4CAA74